MSGKELGSYSEVDGFRVDFRTWLFVEGEKYGIIDSLSVRARGTEKAPVAILVEQYGRAKAKPIERVYQKTLGENLRMNIHGKSTIVTDEWSGYTGIGEHFEGHEIVLHKDGEYVRETPDGKKFTTNEAESFIALIKPGHYGIFHQYSKKHMHRYITETEFRWNHRKVSDAERRNAQSVPQAERD